MSYPWIATDLPEINEDATEFTFDIRTDVTYSDGTPLTAENVVRNIDLYSQGDDERHSMFLSRSPTTARGSH